MQEEYIELLGQEFTEAEVIMALGELIDETDNAILKRSETC